MDLSCILVFLLWWRLDLKFWSHALMFLIPNLAPCHLSNFLLYIRIWLVEKLDIWEMGLGLGHIFISNMLSLSWMAPDFGFQPYPVSLYKWFLVPKCYQGHLNVNKYIIWPLEGYKLCKLQLIHWLPHFNSCFNNLNVTKRKSFYLSISGVVITN